MSLKTSSKLSDKKARFYKGLYKFADCKTQREALVEFLKTGSYKAAAEELQTTADSVRNRLKRLRHRAARRGYDPEHDMTEPTSQGYHIKGVSTLYKVDPETGQKNQYLQWVKTNKDEDDRLDLLLEAIQPVAEEVKGQSPFVPKLAKDNHEDLMCVYPMGDPHIGMHAWAEETGDKNFNLKIAKENFLTAMKHLVDLAPPAKTGMVLNLGDFYHADNYQGVTSRSGHSLDVDTRLPKVFRTGVYIMIQSILMALEKHENVVVYCLLGNHDDTMAMVLSVCLESYFNNNPRVTVVTEPKQHHYLEFGKNLLGMHHGHSTKAKDLPAVMATDMAQAWGRTRYRRWYCGHVHHDSVKDYPGVKVETLRTLAPRDAWHAGQGYRSDNDMKVDVWHKDKGHINRHIVGIEAILEEVSKKSA